MRTVYIGFSKSNKKFPIFSWLVQLYQRTNYSHTYLRIQQHELLNAPCDMYFQASEGKVNLMSEYQFEKRNQMVCEYRIELTDVEFDTLMHIIYIFMGERYGIMQNIGIVIVDIFMLFGKKIKNPFPKGIICSEFIHEIFAPIIDVNSMDKNVVKPKDLKKILDKK